MTPATEQALFIAVLLALLGMLIFLPDWKSAFELWLRAFSYHTYSGR